MEALYTGNQGKTNVSAGRSEPYLGPEHHDTELLMHHDASFWWLKDLGGVMLCPRQFSSLFSMVPLSTCISPFSTSSFHIFLPSMYFATWNTLFTTCILGLLVHQTMYYWCLPHINATWFTYLSLDYWFLTLMLLLPLPWLDLLCFTVCSVACSCSDNLILLSTKFKQTLLMPSPQSLVRYSLIKTIDETIHCHCPWISWLVGVADTESWTYKLHWYYNV